MEVCGRRWGWRLSWRRLDGGLSSPRQYLPRRMQHTQRMQNTHRTQNMQSAQSTQNMQSAQNTQRMQRTQNMQSAQNTQRTQSTLTAAGVWARRENLCGDSVQANIKAAAMQLPVVESTQRHQVIQPRFSTLGPVLDMMGIHVL
jgi:hypothetical protein